MITGKEAGRENRLAWRGGWHRDRRPGERSEGNGTGVAEGGGALGLARAVLCRVSLPHKSFRPLLPGSSVPLPSPGPGRIPWRLASRHHGHFRQTRECAQASGRYAGKISAVRFSAPRVCVRVLHAWLLLLWALHNSFLLIAFAKYQWS